MKNKNVKTFIIILLFIILWPILKRVFALGAIVAIVWVILLIIRKDDK